MKGHRWNKVKQRLLDVTASGLDISFNNNPIRRKYRCGEYKVVHFHIKLAGEIIWRYPTNSKQFDSGPYYENTPIEAIVNYLDLNRDNLLEYEDIVGLSDILKVCDKRIGYNRLKNLELSDVAKKIFDLRFKNILV